MFVVVRNRGAGSAGCGYACGKKNSTIVVVTGAARKKYTVRLRTANRASATMPASREPSTARPPHSKIRGRSPRTPTALSRSANAPPRIAHSRDSKRSRVPQSPPPLVCQRLVAFCTALVASCCRSISVQERCKRASPREAVDCERFASRAEPGRSMRRESFSPERCLFAMRAAAAAWGPRGRLPRARPPSECDARPDVLRCVRDRAEP